MVTFVLDASAILRYLDGEVGVDRVREIIKLHIASEARVVISAIQWGEIHGVLLKRHSAGTAQAAISRISAFDFEVVPATAERAVRAAAIKVKMKIPYADAFGVELAGDSKHHVLVTADFDVKPAEGDVAIEFLPNKISGKRGPLEHGRRNPRI